MTLSPSDTPSLIVSIIRLFAVFCIVGLVYSALATAALHRWGARAAWLSAVLFAAALSVLIGVANARLPVVRPQALLLAMIGFAFVVVPAAIVALVLTRAVRRVVPPTRQSLIARGAVTFLLSAPLGLAAGALVDVLSYAVSGKSSGAA